MSVDWKAMYEQALRKKGEAFDRAVRAERERDAAVDRAEQAEQLIPAYAMLDIWMALGRDSIHFDDWYEDQGYADAWAELTAAVREGRGDLYAARENAEHYQSMFDATERQRDEWKARAENLEREFAEFKGNANRLNVRAVDRDVVEATLADGLHRGLTIDQLTRMVRTLLTSATDYEALARAIEAEQAVDPVEEKARELYRAATPDARWETVADEYRRIARHVLGQEADHE